MLCRTMSDWRLSRGSRPYHDRRRGSRSSRCHRDERFLVGAFAEVADLVVLATASYYVNN